MNLEKLQQRLKDLRHLHKHTQEYLASYLNISRQAYSHYETGRNIPSADVLYKLAKLYSIPPQSLLCFIVDTDETEENPSSPLSPYLNDELDEFLSYANSTENKQKLDSLKRREKEALFYFKKLPCAEQDDMIEFLKIKARRYHKL